MLKKSVTLYGRQVMLACDGRCDKAWGINGRPRTYFTSEKEDPDDYVFLGDQHLGKAPGPGKTKGCSEDGDFKPSEGPLTEEDHMNNWCAKECERCQVVETGQDATLEDMDNPLPNKYERRNRPPV